MSGYRDEQMADGFEQAERFIERVRSGEPIETDALAQQAAIARLGSLERLRGFCAHIQQVLVAEVRDA